MKKTASEKEYARVLAVEYAIQFVGTPYKWGGNNPIEGFDCSGFVCEVLKAVGEMHHSMDVGANTMYEMCKEKRVMTPDKGHLLFWPQEGTKNHVALCIGNGYCIDASGGGRETHTLEDAERAGAFVKIRPVDYLGPFVAVDLFK